ncbi:MAG: TetR/AcrR family transcriptional regulator [Myxococcota bacterium]
MSEPTDARSNPRRRRRRRQPDETKAKIVEATHALMSDGGAASLTTAAIAKAAGVSEGIIFHHFGSKKGLLQAVATEVGRGVAMAMFQGMAPGQRPDVQRMIRAVFEFVQKRGKMNDLMLMSRDIEEANAALNAQRTVIVGSLTQAFTQWKAMGYIETSAPEIAAALIFGLVESGLHDCFVRGNGERMDEYIDEAVACIEGALGYEGPHSDPEQAR